ncbi:alpha/beta fold hydrolase [Actinophytocola algeriensis]|uniref:Pimeloyl-ACP methyl ester carboxylesterase n=1 Tax=Actinophytocola algeriensis TaxID=1768010 RepID=A0A7W7Q9V6_9PSEU|nr:alpha/beta fold hydrolase [Actinophytocola algeriensis]MBB4909707.1 pimeloyl-ACP methyl ester carboxylesterase [Actinophytocola algeriensis]MBE1475697.1 pimeloyl-ACP methyl ester carboxylesterase [Actinophytocola algeriensis]
MSLARADDGVSLFYEVNGVGDDVLVLIAGQANNHHWWDVSRPDFDARFRTVVFDHRGTGRSDKPETGYSTRGFAADVRAILDDMGVERAHVYGTSMGGRVAQWFAADHPDRVRGLVLGCTSPGGAHGIERSAEVRRSLAQRDTAAARQALLELMYTPGWLAAHPGPFNTVGDPGMPAHARRGHFTASKEHDGWDALAKITAPTLVVHGADDVFNPAANAPVIASRVPDARLHLIPGARHAYFEEYREVASPLVLAHLDG